MSEEAFREKKCSCHECESVNRLREIIKEKDRIIDDIIDWIRAESRDCGCADRILGNVIGVIHGK